jgi:hypothetical protein
MAKKGTKLIKIVAKILTFGFVQTLAFVAKWAIGLAKYKAFTSFRALKN